MGRINFVQFTPVALFFFFQRIAALYLDLLSLCFLKASWDSVVSIHVLGNAALKIKSIAGEVP